jgi:hypothetical protein
MVAVGDAELAFARLAIPSYGATNEQWFWQGLTAEGGGTGGFTTNRTHLESAGTDSLESQTRSAGFKN